MCVYVKSHIVCRLLSPRGQESFEIVWLETQSARNWILLAAVYVPPGLGQTLHSCLRDHIAATHEAFLGDHPHGVLTVVGDFNDFSAKELADVTGSHIQRTDNTRKHATLDFLLTTHPLYYKNVILYLSAINTDHYGILAEPRNKPPSETFTKMFRDTKPANLSYLHDRLMEIDFHPIINQCDVDIDLAVEQLDLQIMEAFEICCPLRRVKMRTRDPDYISPYVKHLCRKKNRLLRLKRFKEAEHVRTCIGKLITNNLRVKRRANSKAWWKEVNSILGRTRAQNAHHAGHSPEELNDVFTDICTDTQYQAPDHVQVCQDILPALSLHQVYYAMCAIKRTATGPDGIPWFVWKHNAHILAPVVHSIFAKSLAIGVFPKSWKKSNVTPIPKTANPTISDYRPISVTCIIARCFERLVYRFFTKDAYHRVLDPCQFGFREKSSTAMAAITLQNVVHDFRNLQSDYVRVLSLDLSKAFDRVSHRLVVSGLQNIPGLNLHVIRWYRSFLMERQQRVTIGNRSSDWRNINRGVPQGTVSGPPCFNASTNGLRVPTNLANHCVLLKFADDMYPIVAGTHDDTDKDIMVFVTNWLKERGFLINRSKCKDFIIPAGQRICMPVPLDGFKRVNKLSFLGFTFAGKLSPALHVHKVCTKARRNLNLLLKLKHGLNNRSHLEAAYRSLVLSVLLYGVEVYGGESISTLGKIDSVQRKAVRIGMIGNFTPILDIIRSRDSRLLQLTQREDNLLNPLMTCRTSYAENRLRQRLPATRSASRSQNLRIFPNRVLKMY